MRAEFFLKVIFHGPWQIASGIGDGAVADSVVIKDELGLPIVPGRTLKGLIREAMLVATEAGSLPPDRIERWLGSPRAGLGSARPEEDHELQQEAGRFGTNPGRLWFGSAGLPDSWTKWVSSQAGPSGDTPPEVMALYGLHASTAIDADGVAAEHTLRVIEATVPMELQARVVGPDDDATWVSDIRTCLPLIRALGTGRNRGFGRVRITLEEVR